MLTVTLHAATMNTKSTSNFFIHSLNTKIVSDIRLPHRCKWGLPSYEMLRSVDW